MNRWVLDASVAAKWYLPSEQEPLAEEALSLFRSLAFGRIRLIVPDLFWPETGNILWKAARTGRIKPASAEVAMRDLVSVGIETVSCTNLAESALQIALNCDRSVYDATYLALAIISGCPLLTADERLVNALGARFPVRWLGGIASY